MSFEYYEILEVERDADAHEIKRAYRKKAMKYHPDRNWWDKSAEKKFKQINEAYSILSNEKKRVSYDRFWKEWANWMWGNWWWFSWFWNWWFEVNLEDIFENFMWGNWWWFSWFWNRSNSNVVHWEDILVNIDLTFEESILWKEAKINYSKKIKCSWCNWTWAKDESDLESCKACNWQWRVKKQVRSLFWIMEQVVQCSDCSGNWKVIKNKCKTCNWNKLEFVDTTKEVEIPAWIEDWMKMKLNNDWSEWINSHNWDLYIVVNIPNELKWLTREWNNLLYTINIDPVEAVLWTSKKIKIPIIWNKEIDIKQWLQHWEKILFKWLWVTYLWQDKKWDLVLTIDISIPKRLAKEERELYEKIAKLKKLNIKNKKWFLDKIFG